MKHVIFPSPSENVTSRDCTASEKTIDVLYGMVLTAEDAEPLELLDSRTPEGENGVKELSRRVSYNEPVLSVMGPTKSEGSATEISPPFEVAVNENGRIKTSHTIFISTLPIHDLQKTSMTALRLLPFPSCTTCSSASTSQISAVMLPLVH
ncbi:hypothetical protein ACEPAI_1980 [Sanghuangporus weigelae]